jgi:hypothetical protein
MLLYYHSWMFYNHFITTLYHFLGLTYWHSAQCQLLFFACFFTSRKINTKRSPNATKLFGDFFWTRRHLLGQRSTRGGLRGEHNPPGHALGPTLTWCVVPTSAASRTASLLFKYPENPKTLGESTKHNSSRRKFQNHQIQSRHHHGGVHHPHWCLFDDAWVVHCRPTGP